MDVDVLCCSTHDGLEGILYKILPLGSIKLFLSVAIARSTFSIYTIRAYAHTSNTHTRTYQGRLRDMVSHHHTPTSTIVETRIMAATLNIWSFWCIIRPCSYLCINKVIGINVSCLFIFYYYWLVNKSGHSAKPIYKPLTFQARTGCAEYLPVKGRNALHSKLWTRGDSNHCHCATRALSCVCVMC